MVLFSMTLEWNSLNPDFKATPIFDAEYVINAIRLIDSYLGLQWITCENSHTPYLKVVQ